MKYLKNYEQLNEEWIGFPIGMVIGILFVYVLYIRANGGSRYPSLAQNPFKALIRWYKMSKVIKKYDKLLKELNNELGDDPKLKKYYNDIKKIGHKTPGYFNMNRPTYYLDVLYDYIIEKVPEKEEEIDNLMYDMKKEITKIGYDDYGHREYGKQDISKIPTPEDMKNSRIKKEEAHKKYLEEKTKEREEFRRIKDEYFILDNVYKVIESSDENDYGGDGIPDDHEKIILKDGSRIKITYDYDDDYDIFAIKISIKNAIDDKIYKLHTLDKEINLKNKKN